MAEDHDGGEAANVRETLDLINRAWLEKEPRRLEPFLDERVVMVFPGFTARSTGAKSFIEGFVDFCANATVDRYDQQDLRIDVVGETAVASFTFEMLYERTGAKYLSKGRDLWIFSKVAGRWKAVWRTMLDLAEEPASFGSG
jgi:hypothetical protein